MMADLVLTGGKIHTRSCPSATAVAAAAGTIVYVGDDDTARQLAGPHSKVIDVAGCSVVPGLIDTHIHFVKMGLDLDKVFVQPRRTSDIIEAVREKAAVTPPGEWIWVFGEDHLWHEHDLDTGRLPASSDLDQATRDHPVICHVGQDSASLNTSAGRALGSAWQQLQTGSDTSGGDQDSGRIYSKGITRTLKRLMPELSRQRLQMAIARCRERMLGSGVTSVLDAGRAGSYNQDLAAYKELDDQGQLDIRVTLMQRPQAGQPVSDISAALVPPNHGKLLSTGWLKLFADGEFDDALTTFEHLDRPGYHGTPDAGEDEIYELTMAALNAGWRVCTHALGDQAVLVTVTAYERAAAGRRLQPGTLAIAHAFCLDPDMIARCIQNSFALHLQPSLMWTFGDEMIERWGRRRAAASNPYRTLMQSTALVGAGSDVYPPDATVGMRASILRDTKGGLSLGEQERLTGERALELYTVRSAAAMGRPELGTIARGRPCDLAVFPDHPAAVAPDKLPDLTTLLTVVAGRVVHDNR